MQTSRKGIFWQKLEGGDQNMYIFGSKDAFCYIKMSAFLVNLAAARRKYLRPVAMWR